MSARAAHDCEITAERLSYNRCQSVPWVPIASPRAGFHIPPVLQRNRLRPRWVSIFIPKDVLLTVLPGNERELKSASVARLQAEPTANGRTEKTRRRPGSRQLNILIQELAIIFCRRPRKAGKTGRRQRKQPSRVFYVSVFSVSLAFNEPGKCGRGGVCFCFCSSCVVVFVDVTLSLVQASKTCVKTTVAASVTIFLLICQGYEFLLVSVQCARGG